jgi:acyl-CoA synthetase (AMP-forming)/AMP-acid ligase II
VVDGDGWYYTGDLAVVDERGYVRIVGRKRDLIIRGGYNVVPAEVETVLTSHPGIREAAVVGVPERLTGEAIWAFVVADGSPPEPQDLRRFCAERLDPGKVPDQVRVVAHLPVAESGEVRKAALRELAAQEAGPAQPETSSRQGADSG